MVKYNVKNVIKALSVDCVIFGFETGELEVLLCKRSVEPFKDQWALPGGFVRYDEDIDNAAKRILNDFTGVNKVFMEQLQAFGDVDRCKKSPYGRAVTIVYKALVQPGKFKLIPGADADETRWFNIKKVPKLIYDHNRLIKETLKGLKRKIKYEPVGFELLPKKFTLFQLQELYEAIWNVKFDKPNFRRKILNMNLIIKLDEKQNGVSHRHAALYKFDKKRYDLLSKKGMLFEM